MSETTIINKLHIKYKADIIYFIIITITTDKIFSITQHLSVLWYDTDTSKIK